MRRRRPDPKKKPSRFPPVFAPCLLIALPRQHHTSAAELHAELGKILSWAAGVKTLPRRIHGSGIVRPARLKERKDALDQFLNEWIARAPKHLDTKDWRIASSALHMAYLAWAQCKGLPTLGPKAFAKAL